MRWEDCVKRDVRNAGEEHDRTDWRSAEGDREAVAVASHLNRDVRGKERILSAMCVQRHANSRYAIPGFHNDKLLVTFVSTYWNVALLSYTDMPLMTVLSTS